MIECHEVVISGNLSTYCEHIFLMDVIKCHGVVISGNMPPCCKHIDLMVAMKS